MIGVKKKRFFDGDDYSYQIFVLILISFPYITSQVVVFYDSVLWKWSAWNIAFSIILNFGCIMIYWNYYLACTTEPGAVDPGWIEKYDQLESVSQHLEQRNDVNQQSFLSDRVISILVGRGKHKKNEEYEMVQNDIDPPTDVDPKKIFKFCQKCNIYKPFRAHHCSVCNRCVLKMDHHCPWINNCVGHYNQGHFVRFLFYVDFTCSTLFFRLVYFMFEMYEYLYVEDRRIRIGLIPFPLSTAQLVISIIDIISVGMVLLMVGILSLYQLYYITTNTTTIESFEKDRIFSHARRKKIKLKYPYNLGLVENVRQVLGDNIIFWLCPQNMNGDGIRFKTKQGLRSEGIKNEIYYHHMSEELKAYADWDDDDGFLV